MYKKIFSSSKLINFIKNKYSKFVLKKAILLMNQEQKIEMYNIVRERMSKFSTKDHAKIENLLNILIS